MQYDDILIRYGEMALKGKNRGSFEKQLGANLRQKLSEYPQVKVERTYGRMYLSLNGAPFEQVAEKVKSVFGITSFSPAKRLNSFELEDIKEAALAVFQDVQPKPETFKVETKRPNKQFPHRSIEVNRALGSHLLKNIEGLRVDVHQPDVELRVEIRNEGVSITSANIPGLKGFPVGTSGKSMLLLSGGLDSPVAGWMMMKRGVPLEGIHFESPPFTSERSRNKVLDLAGLISHYGYGLMRVHMVPFTEIQTQIRQKCPENYMITIMRRFMMRIAVEIAKKRRALSIATGESIGQVASQTMESMHTINAVTNFPILRPLVSMDKSEIIDMAHKIGTFETSILPYEDSCTIFVPKSPITRPVLERAEEYEAKLDVDALVRDAIERTELVEASAEAQGESNLHLF